MAGEIDWWECPIEVARWRDSKARNRMSLAERGLYFEMLLYQWKELDLPSAVVELARVVAASEDEVSSCLPNVRREFDRVQGDRLQNAYLESVRERKTDGRSKTSAKNGQLGGRPKKPKENLTGNQNKPTLISDSDSDLDSSFFQDEGFSEFAAAYPKDSGIHSITLQHWYVEALGSSPADEHARIMAGLARMKASGTEVKYMPSAEDFLRKKRYLERWEPSTKSAYAAMEGL